MPATVHEQQGGAAAQAASLTAHAVDHVERAAVCLQHAIDHAKHGDPQVSRGGVIALAAVLAMLRHHRETLVDEQSAMVDAYADALRRAEGQRR